MQHHLGRNLATIVALINPPIPLADQVVTFDEPGEHTIVVPDGYRYLRIQLWGAGGGFSEEPGGAGGYTAALFPVTPGQSFAILVGVGGGNHVTPSNGAGFGGNPSYFSGSTGGQGGGLSGLFSVASITATDSMNALAIAGGGGGGGSTAAGGNGNADSAGGQPNMQGIHGTAHHIQFYGIGGGGGGYQGGNHDDETATGGSGSVCPTALSRSIEAAPAGTLVPPQTTDPNYKPLVGVGGNDPKGPRIEPAGNGLVVLTWTNTP